MRGFLPVLKKEVRELTRSKRVLAMILFIGILMTIVPLYVLKGIISSVNPERQIVVSFADSYAAFYSLIIVLYVSLSSLYKVFYEDKLRKTLESLLATPLKLRTIWLAKTCAILAVSYTISIIVTILFLLIINFYFHLPELLIPSSRAFFVIIALCPIVSFSIIALMGVIYLQVTDGRIGGIIPIGIIIALFQIVKSSGPGITWDTVILFSAISIALLLIVLLSSKLLSVERIIRDQVSQPIPTLGLFKYLFRRST